MIDEEIKNEIEEIFGKPKNIIFKNGGYISSCNHPSLIDHSEAFLYTGRFEGYKAAIELFKNKKWTKE